MLTIKLSFKDNYCSYPFETLHYLQRDLVEQGAGITWMRTVSPPLLRENVHRLQQGQA